VGRVKAGRTKRQRPPRDERMAAGADQFTQAYSEAVAFAFTDCDATWKQLEREPEEHFFALLDGRDVSRAGLTSVAASLGLPYAPALLLASVDYAHRTGRCAQQGAVLHELVSAARPEGEPAELSALLERLRLVHQAGTKCQAVVDAFA
jgi:hypothetical protein